MKEQNVIRVVGKVKYQKRIKDMKVGESGYTVPWAYEPCEEHLNKRAIT